MTKREALRQTHQEHTLIDLGFTRDEAAALRRISLTLRRWFERECGDGYGCIERDETSGKALWRNAISGRAYPIPDRETGAQRRLAAILADRNSREHIQTYCTVCNQDVEAPYPFTTWTDRGGNWTCKGLLHHKGAITGGRGSLTAYIQTDPRGAALYLIRPGDVPEGGDVSAYYSRGVCIY